MSEKEFVIEAHDGRFLITNGAEIESEHPTERDAFRHIIFLLARELVDLRKQLSQERELRYRMEMAS